MAVRRWEGIIYCSECDGQALIWWLQASNMPQTPEALPEGWTFAEGNASCGVHADLELSLSEMVEEWPMSRADQEEMRQEDETDGY